MEREPWDINLCIKEVQLNKKDKSFTHIYFSSKHDMCHSETYNILRLLLNNDIGREVFSYLWDYKLMPCHSFKYGYYELSQIYLEDCLHQYNTIVDERKSYPSKDEMHLWPTFDSCYHDEIMYTVDCIENSMSVLIGMLKKICNRDV